MVVWESYSGAALDGYDIYYQEFHSDGSTTSAQVNSTLFTRTPGQPLDRRGRRWRFRHRLERGRRHRG